MVMSIKEEITAVEEEIANLKGPGSVKKKKELEDRLVELQKSNDETKEASQPLPEPKEKKGPSSDEPVMDKRPMPVNWVKASPAQVQAAEKAGTLVGYDPDKGLALFR